MSHEAPGRLSDGAGGSASSATLNAMVPCSWRPHNDLQPHPLPCTGSTVVRRCLDFPGRND